MEINEGESGYVSDVRSLPVKLSAVPAFQLLDKIPSPSTLDFDDIEIPIDLLPDVGTGTETAAAAATAAVAADNDESDAPIDISGTYELEVEYDKDVPSADRQ